ncbi:PRC-barrel domain-containing protein [Jeotgalibacillus campisalis]|uniref:Photosystem reaction center subunit H n=1 Tax=Jeotgalibacillus campisalis TaxID=220754 RepID=A0A0C2RWS0_9BACL|nr:PRC-barrel domain-containing protein [Jeotgalibacillus campisalis]KIL46214.1 photosystem reaction center subunit H [Jeotgalibacillus campisalis]
MKNSTELIGLPVISITDGLEIGTVKSIVVNPEKRSVDFIAIEHEDWQTSVRAIPFKKIIGLGEYAVTVEQSSAIIDLNEIPLANQLLNRKIAITETKAMSKKGRLIGEIKEYYFNEDSGLIEHLEIESAQDRGYLKAEMVITYGKDIIVLEEAAYSSFQSSLFDDEPIIEVEKQNEGVTLLSQIKDKQSSLLVGRRLTSDVKDDKGIAILQAGSELTKADIELAQRKGPAVFAKLATSVN